MWTHTVWGSESEWCSWVVWLKVSPEGWIITGKTHVQACPQSNGRLQSCYGGLEASIRYLMVFLRGHQSVPIAMAAKHSQRSKRGWALRWSLQFIIQYCKYCPVLSSLASWLQSRTDPTDEGEDYTGCECREGGGPWGPSWTYTPWGKDALWIPWLKRQTKRKVLVYIF